MKFLEGTILKINGQTVTVVTNRVFKHPRFRKIIVRSSKTMSHLDVKNTDLLNCEVGDTVLAKRTRPISRRKHSEIVFNKTKGVFVKEYEQ